MLKPSLIMDCQTSRTLVKWNAPKWPWSLARFQTLWVLVVSVCFIVCFSE